MQDEENLVQRAKARDQEAFAQIYEEHFDRVYRYVALKIGDVTEAEDMTQQVFLKALQSIPSFNWRGTPIVAWLLRIAHNQVVDYFRKKTKQVTVPLDESLATNSPDPQFIAEQNLDIAQLISATGRLTAAQREVIALRFASGLSVAEAAKVMGKSQGAVKALQHSAVVALRKALAD